MATDVLKEEMANIIEQALKGNAYFVRRVDYRTINVKIPSDDRGSRWFEIRVKEHS